MILEALLALAQDATPRSSDWITTGVDCERFATGDVDGDGFDDVLTVNGARELCVAFTVRGWKASAWRKLLDAPEGVVGFAVIEPVRRGAGAEVAVWTTNALEVHRFGDGALARRTGFIPKDGSRFSTGGVQDGELVVATGAQTSVRLVAGADELAANGRFVARRPALRGEPPPYERVDGQLWVPAAALALDADGDGIEDAIEAYTCERPHRHRVLRLTLGIGAADADRDGLDDVRERALRTDPFDRATDDDGLLDGWEVDGLPDGFALNDVTLDARHQDVIVAISRYAELDETATRHELHEAQHLFDELATANPDGKRGIRLHPLWLPPVPKERQGNWPEVGERELAPAARGIVHWMQVTPGGGGQSMQCGDQGGCGLNWAAFAHELGHQLGLSHTGDSTPAWCPLYPSLMNYAFNYSFGGRAAAIRFSGGRFRGVELREDALSETLPFPIGDLRYLAAPPFRFTLQEADERTTRIDWNHDGVFSEAPVRADVNYGGSTSCGVRHDVELAGTGPALGRIGETIVLARADASRFGVRVQAYEGGERWSPAIALEPSGPVSEVLVAGGARAAWVLARVSDGWDAWGLSTWSAESKADDGPLRAGPRFRPAGLGTARVAPAELGARPGLLVELENRRWTLREASVAEEVHTHAPDVERPMELDAPRELDFETEVPPGAAWDRAKDELVLAGAGTHPTGAKHALKIARFQRLSLVKLGERWAGGANAPVSCTTRPSARVTPEGELFVFHTAGRNEKGEMTLWRTTPVARRALDDGWLVTQLYDEWTRTTVPIAFEITAQGACFAYRWNTGYPPDDMLQVAYDGLGIDRAPMRDFDDGALMSQWGIRHSILLMRR